jgi:hypothetical protein
MSAIASIVLDDAQTTPVSHSFLPVSHSNREFIWRDSTVGLTVLSAPVIHLIVLPSKDKSIERYREKIILPTLETLTSSAASGYQAAPKIAYTLQKISDYIIPSRATEEQRKDLVKYGRLISTSTQFIDVLYYGLLPY